MLAMRNWKHHTSRSGCNHLRLTQQGSRIDNGSADATTARMFGRHLAGAEWPAFTQQSSACLAHPLIVRRAPLALMHDAARGIGRFIAQREQPRGLGHGDEPSPLLPEQRREPPLQVPHRATAGTDEGLEFPPELVLCGPGELLPPGIRVGPSKRQRLLVYQVELYGQPEPGRLYGAAGQDLGGRRVDRGEVRLPRRIPESRVIEYVNILLLNDAPQGQVGP